MTDLLGHRLLRWIRWGARLANAVAARLCGLLRIPALIPGWLGRRLLGEAEWEAWKNLVMWTIALGVAVAVAWCLRVYMEVARALTRPFIILWQGIMLFYRLLFGTPTVAARTEAGAVPLLYGPVLQAVRADEAHPLLRESEDDLQRRERRRHANEVGLLPRRSPLGSELNDGAVV